MSKIDNLDPINDRYRGEGFRDNEIARFEEKFPGTKIIKKEYNSEKQLELDWAGYLSTPYHTKVLANDLSIRLFGMRNEDHYYQQKRKFLRMDIESSKIDNVYHPIGESSDLANKMALDYMDNGGFRLLRIDYEDEASLNNDYSRYLAQPYDHQKIADTKSIELYGYPVRDIYRREIRKFLEKDIPDSNYDSLLYTVGSQTESVLAIYDAVRNSNDTVEKLIMTEETMRREAESDDIANAMILESMILSCSKDLNSVSPLSEGIPQFFVPWEINDLVECDKNFLARNLGIKPELGYYDKVMQTLADPDTSSEDRLKIGWNSSVPFTMDNWKKAAKRVNHILKENMHYSFLDMSKMKGIVAESKENLYKGISVMIVKELDKDSIELSKDQPKVLITTDYTNPNWSSVIYGQTSYVVNVEDLLKHFSHPSVTVYFMKVDNAIDLSKLMDDNIIQRVCYALNSGCPEITNKQLYVANMLNLILNPTGDDEYGLSLNRHPDGKKDLVHILFSKSGRDIKYSNILSSFNKMNVLDEMSTIYESSIFSNINRVAVLEDTVPSAIPDYTMKYSAPWKKFRDLFDIDNF